jgi:teichuronic acid biosynthesis glycosyltransferase TuaC
MTENCNFVSPKFFTLPFEALRKRNCCLAARSCIGALSRNAVPFDLIHAHFLQNGFIGARMKDLYTKPFVVTAHGGDVYDLPFRDNWTKRVSKYVLSEADQVITVSQFNAEKLLSLGLSPNKLHVIPNGYDARLFKLISSRAMRQELGLPLGKRILLSVGNLVGEKGHTCLIAAMNTVLKRRSDVILVIVGSGPLKERLEKKITQLGLNGKVLLVGRKAHEEIPMWMNASDIFVLPSINEGFPTVVPEAMACVKPVIGTKVGGIPEAITNDDLGILVNPKDPEILESAILKALEKKWKPETILEHAKTYSWSNLATQILTVYQKALLNWES